MIFFSFLFSLRNETEFFSLNSLTQKISLNLKVMKMKYYWSNTVFFPSLNWDVIAPGAVG